tara:strand:- start:677 stop:1216 length:540 start_codon:yes stop_codon:yes gene_type:complete
MKDDDLLKLCNRCLDYNHQTGIITWVEMISKFSNKLVGQEAGCYTRGYKTLRINGINHLAHRIAFLMHHGFMPLSIDHINGIKDDNRSVNLRECTIKENNRNCGVRENNSTGYKGVHKLSNKRLTTDKWVVMIGSDDGPKYKGIFTTPELAAQAYDKAALEYHGEFALTNKSMGLINEL